MRSLHNKTFLIVSIISALWMKCSGQDPTFSNFNFNQAYYNPAYTGYYEGYNVSITSHTLWPNVPGKIFPGALSTNAAYADIWLNKGHYFVAGIGLIAISDVEGESFLQTNTFGVSYAQQIYLSGKGRNDAYRLKLSMGVKFYINTISIDWNKLLFGDQLNIDYISQTSAFSHSGTDHTLTEDMDAGVLLQNNFMGAADRETVWHNELGFAIGHILSPATSLLGSPENATHIPRKYVVTYHSTIKMPNNHFYLAPTILFEGQQNFYELNTGIEVYYKLKANTPGVPFGISIMNRLAIQPGISNTNSFIAGISHKGIFRLSNPIIYYMGFSAEFPYGGLGLKTKGTYELSVGFVFPKKGNNRFSQCPTGGYDHSAEIMNWIK